jgi:PAS domain S-box-containing protein
VARRTVVDNMSDGMIVLNLQNQIMDVNPAAKSILGAELDNIMGRSIEHFLTNGPELIGRFDKLLRNNGNVVQDIYEQERWFEVHISSIHDAEKHVRGRVIVLRDITERKRSEAFLAQRNEILQTLNTLSQEMSSSLELQTLLNTAVKSAAQALNATSAYINDWNQERMTTTVLAEYFASSASSLERISHLGETYKLDTDFGPPSDSELNSYDKYVTHMDDEDISQKFRTHMEHHGVKTLLEIPLYAKAKPIGTLEVWESRDKRVFSHEELGLVLEISRQIALAMDNAYLYEDALAVSRLKSTILARVSHELRTPLAIIMLYAEMLQYSEKFKALPDESQNAVDKIIFSADDLAHLIDELLDQSKINSATLSLYIDAYMPSVLLERVYSQMELVAGHKGLTLNTYIEPDVPEFVTGDQNRVKQILVNLIGNAVKFTEEGKVDVQFIRHDETHWAIRVADTGSGISTEEQAYIFEPFRQGVAVEKETRAGIGLGLSIVNQLVELMGGRIHMESEVGQGSVFTVILPLEHKTA